MQGVEGAIGRQRCLHGGVCPHGRLWHQCLECADTPVADRDAVKQGLKAPPAPGSRVCQPLPLATGAVDAMVDGEVNAGSSPLAEQGALSTA